MSSQDSPVTTPTAALSGSFKGSYQSWVKACLWNPIKRKRGYTVTVLLDTGAGGGNYASVKLIHAVQRHVFGVKRIISKRGQGFLHVANPAKDAVPPMSIVRTAVLPLIFPPVDHVFRTYVRVIADPLPTDPGRGIHAPLQQCSCASKGTGSFKKSADTPSVPLLPVEHQRNAQPWRDGANYLQLGEGPGVSMAPGWKAARHPVRSGRARDQETGGIVSATGNVGCEPRGPPDPGVFCSVEWRASQQTTTNASPAEDDLMAALDLGSTAWEDSTSL